MTEAMVAGARTALAACLLVLGVACNAYAEDAYWHGSRDSNWTSGIRGDLSNWYAKPPLATQNTPLQPPDRIAYFAPTARDHHVIVENKANVAVEEMQFLAGNYYPGSGNYWIEVRRNSFLTVTGKGLINETGPPVFIFIDRGTFQLTNAARLVSGNDLRIHNQGGEVRFLGSSKGGATTVFNTNNGPTRGDVYFTGRSTAGSMSITNAGKAATSFDGLSTAGDADLVNNYDFYYPGRALIDFEGTTGPADDHRLTAGSIANNFGTLQTGINHITILRNLAQGDNGTLVIDVIGSRAGALRVRGTASLAGTLVVRSSNPQIGRHVLIRATGGRTGAFSKVKYSGFPPTLRGRIVVSNTDVILHIESR